ncbi:TPA: lipopolysaccharide biosynthesis protein [Bacillus cereus]|uniref:lipopolysaccharide biosynthesis protein n=1 Tax=Bacillus anthracis TaxID=1392 RepID=UPI0037316A46
MKDNKLQNNIINATKWSTITEIAAKLVTPVTNMILARIVSPEAFGVVATITMIVSFIDMFTDSGFQKYLVQHEFKNKEEKYKSANVAFWTNLGISLLLWGVIILFCEKLAMLVGSPGMGNVLAIACFQLPLTAFSGIQMALYRRDFDFKTLFLVRLISIFIPLLLTVPLALLGLSYWALIIGTITMQLSNAIILTLKSKWKPNFYYNIKVLKEMFSFSVWSLVEAISIWLTIWVDTFIIGRLLNQHQVGLYKTSTTMVNALMSLITASTVPVLFSALSRFQEDTVKFNNLYFKFQRIVSIIVFPLGIGLYLYSDLATALLLGNQWSEASDVIGMWALTSSIVIVLGHFSSEVYRAKGRPKLSFFAQLMHLIVLVPTCLLAGQYGFWILVYARSLVRIQLVIVHLVIMKAIIGIPVLKIFRNVFPTLISAVSMGLFGYFLQQLNEGILWGVVSILLCIIIYFGILSVFSNIRKEIIGGIKRFMPKRAINKKSSEKKSVSL